MADVVGYSRLMATDEVGTLEALKRRRKDILDPIVKARGGKVVKLMGDGVLVEFASAVKAVEAAVELQEKFAKANEGIDDHRRILIRIGINLGDVIGEGSDIYGDGVNIAARLETLAEPGIVSPARYTMPPAGRYRFLSSTWVISRLDSFQHPGQGLPHCAGNRTFDGSAFNAAGQAIDRRPSVRQHEW